MFFLQEHQGSPRFEGDLPDGCRQAGGGCHQAGHSAKETKGPSKESKDAVDTRTLMVYVLFSRARSRSLLLFYFSSSSSSIIV